MIRNVLCLGLSLVCSLVYIQASPGMPSLGNDKSRYASSGSSNDYTTTGYIGYQEITGIARRVGYTSGGNQVKVELNGSIYLMSRANTHVLGILPATYQVSGNEIIGKL